ncbi:MAG: aminopeptidase N [Cyanobacteriota bacterium]|nr:aminopeptidase N [Cyanobacteriota bacterium]
MTSVRLADYRPSPCLIERTDLTVRLHHDHAQVEAHLALAPNSAGAGPLTLMGVDLALEELLLDGAPLAAEAHTLLPDRLVLHHPPDRPFRLSSRVRLHPHSNTTLEGLYVSGGLFTTQCEAEGFRRITYHPDRPDLLSRFWVRIEADRETCPVLLSNGNCRESGSLGTDPETGRERHYAVWDDPFPKPSYLFALVAGSLVEVSDRFTTASGRPVRLRLHVEPGDEHSTAHAMAALQRAMRWDEQVYGLEYDLEEYNIVAVRHFNMGAMENKSLNIFNSKLVLADAETATDAELERVESVIAHEYFHNWTGNRITCRDWFQLSLKEGLTVLRDQQFSADQHGHALARIEHVAVLRNTQFREDAGPTAHPVQPSSYQAIDNFYTTTIYEKGAEVIRMLHTLLGDDTYHQGIALYVKRHDGTAATCDDFLAALREAAESRWAAEGRDAPPPFDFAEFRRWYHQAGTPLLRLWRRWDQRQGRLTLRLHQQIPPTNASPNPKPQVIPLAIGLVDQAGQALPVRLVGESEAEASAARQRSPHWGDGTRVLVIDREHQEVVLDGLPRRPHPPALSLLRQFSAPIQLRIGRPTSELVHLLAADPDPVARWDAGQVLLRRAVLRRAAGRADGVLEEELINAFERILADPSLSEASRSLLLALPGLAELEDGAPEPDPPALFAALLALQRRFGEALAQPLARTLEDCLRDWTAVWPRGSGARRLTGTIWSWGVAAGDPAAIAAARAAVEGGSMTLARAGLRALHPHDLPQRTSALAAFYDRWQDRPVILDSWFSLEASTPFGDGLARVAHLLEHPRYDPMAPNSVRAVLGGFVAATPVFHASDGSGYRFLAQQIIALDQRNPITASRLSKVFSRWQSYGPNRRAPMADALQQLARATLSTNTREVVEQCLGER